MRDLVVYPRNFQCKGNDDQRLPANPLDLDEFDKITDNTIITNPTMRRPWWAINLACICLFG
jgi:hypothetical protein